MKILLIISMLLSINAWADTPNLDTSTSIVTFPLVTVDNDKAYSNVELLLTPVGSWAVLSFELEPEPDFELTGEWKGNLTVDYEVIGIVSIQLEFPPCDVLTSLALIQKGNKLTGTGGYSGVCIENEGIDNANIMGVINGKSISFTLYSNEQKFDFTGFISDDQQALDLLGPSITYNTSNVHTPPRRWLLSLQ